MRFRKLNIIDESKLSRVKNLNLNWEKHFLILQAEFFTIKGLNSINNHLNNIIINRL